jgi:hypothetical protein
MKTLALLLMSLVVLLSGSFNASGARQEEEAPPFRRDSRFSNHILPSLGYPQLKLRETGTSLEGAPARLSAGRYSVTLTAPAHTPSHLLFVQVPQGVPEDEAERLLIRAAAEDVPSEGWVYAGGAFAPPGTTIQFLVDLKPGRWRIAATRESVRPPPGCGRQDKDAPVEEWATLQPLQVTEAALPPEPPVSVDLGMKELSFEGLSDTLPAGPRLWKITTTGAQPRNMIFFKTPRLLTAEEFRRILIPPDGEMPSPDQPSFHDFVWAGEISMNSPGYSTWAEFNLEPGHYLVTSWGLEPESGLPAALAGMARGFTVE